MELMSNSEKLLKKAVRIRASSTYTELLPIDIDLGLMQS